LHHIHHIADVAGIDHVAIGPDYVDYLRPLGRIDHMWDKGPAYPEEVNTAAKLPNLADALLSAGYDGSQVWRIMGGNLFRFYKRMLG